MADKREISLVLADVDGTLVTEKKVLTERAQAAVLRLHEAGIRFAITSGRPAKGMAMLFDPLKLDTPISGFNGGLVIKPDLTIIEQKTVPADVAAQAIELIRNHGLDVWVYRGNDWLVGNPKGLHVEHEAWTVKFEPKVVKDVASALGNTPAVCRKSYIHPALIDGYVKGTFHESLQSIPRKSTPPRMTVNERLLLAYLKKVA